MIQKTGPRELMTPAALYILLSLTEGQRHGYGIKLEVEERTSGSLSLGPGTLYEAIHRMQKSGWIEETPRPKNARGRDARRRYYRLTRLGRSRLEEDKLRVNCRKNGDRSLFGKVKRAPKTDLSLFFQ